MARKPKANQPNIVYIKGRPLNIVDGTVAINQPSLKKKLSIPYKKIVKRTSLIIVGVALVIGGWLGWKIYSDAVKVTGNKNPLALLGLFDNTPLKETDGRVNILVAGYSADDPGHDGADLTDSIMILSIDPTNHTAFMLSIPRDMWVDIPGSGYQKINAAYEDGAAENFSQEGYTNGGMGLLEEVVQQDFGIQSDYSVLVNYTAFRDLVNAVGGINIDIQSSDSRGIYDSNTGINLPNGEATLDGNTALALARSRGDGYGSYGFPDSDFDRTMYQRLMLLAIKDKATSTSVISNPIKVGQLADAIGNNVQTNMSLDEMVSFAKLMDKINDSNIKSVGLNSINGQDLVTDYMTSDGEDALIPTSGIDNYSQIQIAVQKLLQSNNQVLQESASVVLLNGTETDGLAAQQQTVLATDGVSASTGDAPTDYSETTIIDNSNGSKPATLKLLESIYGNNISTDSNLSAQYSSDDFIVILGQNQAN